MKLHSTLVETHAALVELYEHTEFKHLREVIAETIAILQKAIEREKGKESNPGV